MNRIAVLLAGTLLLIAGAVAQESAPQEKARTFTWEESKPKVNFFFQGGGDPQQLEKAFYMTEMTASSELVTNAPYTATAVEENTQTLADGNRIVHKSSDFVARDSQGRTRRETTLSRIGNVQMDVSKMVFINDPTTHTQYVLTQGDATKVVKSEGTWTSGPTIVELQTQNGERRKRIAEEKMAVGRHVILPDANDASDKQVKNEDLGTQTIEGVSAQGHRETVTIPAGQIGNDRAIELVTEIWTSPDLHTVVLRKHSDPRVGETVFRLTNITRNEPDASLFQPPANAKIKVEPMIQLKQREAPKD
jgi:hypothetical protein